MTTPYSTTAANAANDKIDSLSEFEGVVSNLIETLIDGIRGFEVAAEKAAGNLQQQLTAMGAERRKTTEDVIRVAADEHMNPVTLDDQGTSTGVLHRSWITIRDALQGEAGVVSAALNGETHARNQLEETLDKGIPTPIATIARRALGEIEANISTLEKLTS